MPDALPLNPGTWSFDPAHSGVHFKVRHLGLTNIRGRFKQLTANLVVGDTLANTHFDATIDIGSLDTNQPDRDGHLLSHDFFAADANPTMTFVSTAIVDKGDGHYVATGTLTINAVTHPVSLDVEFAGRAVNPADGRERAGFMATTQIMRDEFGIDFNMPLGIDGFALGKKIDVEIDIQFAAPAS